MKFLEHERDQVGDFQKRVLIHIPIGLLIGMSWLAHWVFPLVFAYLFLEYERNEDLHTQDQSWKDIFGALIGFGISVALVVILQFCDVI